MDTDLKYEGKFISVLKAGNWEYVERTNCKQAVSVLAITEDDEVILVEQFRIPVNKYTIESPAGLMDNPAETIEECGRRELLEETGYMARQVINLYENTPASAGLTSETSSKILALGCKKVAKGGGIEDEDIKIHLVHKDKLVEFMEDAYKQGKLFDVKILAGMYIYDKWRQ
jgi:ADP-ribose pyrophosphatase